MAKLNDDLDESDYRDMAQAYIDLCEWFHENKDTCLTIKGAEALDEMIYIWYDPN